MKATHAVHGDRLLITAEIPRESLTESSECPVIGVTMDVDEWRDLNRHILRARAAGERDIDQEALGRRIEGVLRRSAQHALHEGQDPAIARRRAVAAVLHQMADMVVAGTVSRLDVRWPRLTMRGEPLPILGVITATRGGHELAISLDLSIAPDVTP